MVGGMGFGAGPGLVGGVGLGAGTGLIGGVGLGAGALTGTAALPWVGNAFGTPSGNASVSQPIIKAMTPYKKKRKKTYASKPKTAPQ